MIILGLIAIIALGGYALVSKANSVSSTQPSPLSPGPMVELRTMSDSADGRRNPVWQLLVLAALMTVGYICIRTLRFTHDGINVGFVCTFFLTPFLAIRAVLRMRRWPKVLTTILLVPVLAVSLISLLITMTCVVPAAIEHREMSRELSTIWQGRYSVHLVWEETAGGAIGPHGVALQQRKFILPGLYMAKNVDYFEGADEGSISAEGENKVRLQMPKRDWQQEVDKVYSLKPWVYF